MGGLGIDIKLIVAQIINFAVFFIIFAKFIAKPFATFLNIERSKEEEKEKILEDLRKKEEEVVVREVKLKAKAKQEYDLVIKNAKKDALIVRENLLADARKEAEDIKTRARKQTEEEKDVMHKEVKTKIADLSILIVNRALSQFLTADMQKTITDNILKNLPKDVN